ncbi:non-ribosomal peptide synthetase family protein [Microbacterium mangrovi]|uniref:hypothetical protein n=1 Tax=Microbacterium mangrovi TaxID=1348253 RepID=UPI0006923C75|nr:hypothetical protein [Microbacterium mangrovi]
MRLTTVDQMRLPPGTVYSLETHAIPDASRELPLSFDQRLHVGLGDRPGSWMGVAFRIESGPFASPKKVAAAIADAWEAAIARHGTLRTVFSESPDPADERRVRLHEATVTRDGWVRHPRAGRPTRDVLRHLLDAYCRPFATPSHRLCLIVPERAEADSRPVLVIASDHAHVDMWSLLVLADDIRAALAGDPDADPPASAPFALHTRTLEAMPPAPADVVARWRRILDDGDGRMPVFPLPLGDPDPAEPAVVEVRDVLDAAAFARLEAEAQARGVRVIALVISQLAAVFRERWDAPLRAVFPVHSRNEPRWRDSVGWYITNAVLEVADADPAACAAAVDDAVRLGAYPLAPIFASLGGVPETPGMFAISWLDVRRMPLRLDPSLEPQFVSAVLPTDGVMIWFIADESGLHLRCRYPAGEVAARHAGEWLDAVTARIRDAAAVAADAAS